MPVKSRPLAERFWEKVVINTDGCWGWTGAIDPKTGYGRIGAGGRGTGVKGAHVVSYELHYGPVPEGKEVCHRCDNRSCPRPGHLFAGTRSDNMKDCFAKARGAIPNRWKPGTWIRKPE